MIRMMEITGLTADELGYVTGYTMATIACGVFMGICMVIALYSLTNIIGTMICRLKSIIKNRIPNVRKRME